MQVRMRRSLVRPVQPGELVEIPIQSNAVVQGDQRTDHGLSDTPLISLAYPIGNVDMVYHASGSLPCGSNRQGAAKPQQTRCDGDGQCHLLRSRRSAGNHATFSVLVSIQAGKCRNNGTAPRLAGIGNILRSDLLRRGGNSNFNAQHRVHNWRRGINCLLVLPNRRCCTHSSRGVMGIRTYSTKRETPRGDHRTHLAFSKNTRR